MSISVFKIEGQELQEFINKVTKDPNFTLIMGKLIEERATAFTDYKVVDTIKVELEGTPISIVIFEMDNNVKINVHEITGQLQVTASILENNSGKDFFKELRVVNQKLKLENIILCTERHKAVAQKIKEQEINIISRYPRLPCIYGNWCGPGCGGPDDPIDEVDRCCQQHDTCYGEYGYFNCTCDANILRCLLPYVHLGHKWASIMYNYFLHQYSLCCT